MHHPNQRCSHPRGPAIEPTTRPVSRHKPLAIDKCQLVCSIQGFRDAISCVAPLPPVRHTELPLELPARPSHWRPGKFLPLYVMIQSLLSTVLFPVGRGVRGAVLPSLTAALRAWGRYRPSLRLPVAVYSPVESLGGALVGRSKSLSPLFLYQAVVSGGSGCI